MTIAFLLISYLIIGIIFYKMPKRISQLEVYTIWMIVSLAALLSDVFIADILDMYNLFDPGPQVSDVFIEVTLPACFGILYVNFMPENKRKIAIYILFWAIFSVIYEQLSRYFGYVHYKDWKIWYSFLYYLCACLFMWWHICFVRKGINKN